MATTKAKVCLASGRSCLLTPVFDEIADQCEREVRSGQIPFNVNVTWTDSEVVHQVPGPDRTGLRGSDSVRVAAQHWREMILDLERPPELREVCMKVVDIGVEWSVI